MEIGTCVLKNNLNYICVNKKEQVGKIFYEFLGYRHISEVPNCKFDIFTTDNIEGLKEVECSNFVNFEMLYQYIFNLINFKKAKLIGIAFDYGEDWYDDEEEDELAQFVFLYCHDRIIQISIPTGIEFVDEHWNIPYLHVKEISKENIAEIQGHSRYYFLEEDVNVERLNKNNVQDFFEKNESYLILGKYEITRIEGIKLNNILLADFDQETILAIGNGLIYDEEKLKHHEMWKDVFIQRISELLK